MNTSTQISLMLGIAIAVVAACDSTVESAPEKAPPESAVAPDVEISEQSDNFLGTWTIVDVKDCPPMYSTCAGDIPKPEVGDQYEIIKQNDKFRIEGINGWEEIEFTHKRGSILKRLTGSNIMDGDKVKCVSPPLKADRLYGCLPAEGIGHCFDVDLVKESPKHPGKMWSPYISYGDVCEHNGVIH